MDCREARDRLWPADILHVSDTELEAALEHAETCAACRILLKQDQRVAELVRAAVPRVHAPQELRERLQAVLAREPSALDEDSEPTAVSGTEAVAVRRRRRIGRIALVWVALLIVGFAGYRLASRPSHGSAATAFAEDYVRRLVGQNQRWGGDRGEIASLFKRELGEGMSPPEIPDFEVEGATICLMNGRRGGVVEYRSQGRRLTYYVIPAAPEDEEGAQVGTPVKKAAVPPVPAVVEEHGLGIATWQDSRHQHALVGEFTSNGLRRLSALFVNTLEGP